MASYPAEPPVELVDRVTLSRMPHERIITSADSDRDHSILVIPRKSPDPAALIRLPTEPVEEQTTRRLAPD